MTLSGANLKLGWVVLGAIAWAYLGLLVALGLPAQPGQPSQFALGLRDEPHIVSIAGNLQALSESPEGIKLVILQPPDRAGRAVPPLPPGITVDYVTAGEPRDRPRIALERGHGPFPLPTGQQGVIAGGYFVRFGEGSVRIGEIPEHMKRRLELRMDRRRGRPDGGAAPPPAGDARPQERRRQPQRERRQPPPDGR